MAKHTRMRRIVEETVARWKNTITGATPVDIEQAKKTIQAIQKNARIFVVDTPVQFYIAQAVMRGRIAKEKAKHLCTIAGIDPAFIKDLRRVGGSRGMLCGDRWQRHYSYNFCQAALTEHIHVVTKELNEERRTDDVSGRDTTGIDFTDIFSIFRKLVDSRIAALGQIGPPKGIKEEINEKISAHEYAHMAELKRMNFTLGLWQRGAIGRAVITLYDAVSGRVRDILNDDFIPGNHTADLIHTEILCRALGIKDKEVTKYVELMHCVPALMEFANSGYLLLGSNPVMHRNAENNLHNETGPAVEFKDGNKFWYMDGHELTQFGEKIVCHPETLTIADINVINNEEERRLAIDRMGWNKYLAGIGAKVIDRRENWVDGTVEVLVQPPIPEPLPPAEFVTTNWRQRRRAEIEPRRMILACRSTGRKYFLAVPTDEMLEENEPKINTCESAQKWFSNGAYMHHLEYAKYPLNIVGAS